MRATYKYLAFAICLLVVAQAAFIVYANAGLFHWISEDGGVVDKAFLDDESSSFPGVGGFMAHGMNGMMLIPLVALALLVVSFFTKVKGAVAHGAAILGLVILQIVLGLSAHSIPALGPLHGINAFLILGAAAHAARLMSARSDEGATTVGHADAGATHVQA
jgi:uncharacterized sodium:solute symporter family permease YidK